MFDSTGDRENKDHPGHAAQATWTLGPWEFRAGLASAIGPPGPGPQEITRSINSMIPFPHNHESLAGVLGLALSYLRIMHPVNNFKVGDAAAWYTLLGQPSRSRLCEPIWHVRWHVDMSRYFGSSVTVECTFCVHVYVTVMISRCMASCWYASHSKQAHSRFLLSLVPNPVRRCEWQCRIISMNLW